RSAWESRHPSPRPGCVVVAWLVVWTSWRSRQVFGWGVVCGVAGGLLVGVDPGWWGPVGGAVVHVAGPAEVVEVSVVVAAEQGAVVQGGGSAVGPGDDVVGLAPGRGGGAAGE